jgi:hypothetical protein
MFDLGQAIADWRRQMLAAGIKTPETLKELEIHLHDDVEHRVRCGLSVEQAFDKAVQQLGNGNKLKGEFAKTAGLKHRHYIYRGLGFGIGLFVVGVTFCYFALIPAALAASRMYAQWLGFTPAQWNAGEYTSFVCRFMLGMGLGLEMPVMILTLVKIGVLNYRFLSRARKYVIVINLILGALLTTPEVTTQLIMFLPLQLLFEVGIWTAWYWERQERKCVQATGPNRA